MTLKQIVYDRLPSLIKPVAKQTYQNIAEYNQIPDDELHSTFVNEVFDSNQEYKKYMTEFNQGSAVSLRNKALEEYQRMTGETNMYGVSLDVSRDYYAVTRKLKPNVVIETGVCNGISTLAILLAIQKNGSGQLYSIDYPFRADESLEEFRQETFQDYGGAAIPSNKNPGWIIPDQLRSQWNLIIGKSQRELPKLITELKSVELFIHDSEHSHPCMMFEYEIAYEWLETPGMILSDDITWNNAFDIFTKIREPEYGRLSKNVGYISKTNEYN